MALSVWEVLEAILRYGVQTKEGKEITISDLRKVLNGDPKREVHKILKRLQYAGKIKLENQLVILRQSQIDGLYRKGHRSYLEFFKLDRKPIL